MSIAHRLADLQLEIKKAQKNSCLKPESLTLLAASKTQMADSITQAIELGVHTFGENRVQEAADKWPALKEAHPHVKLHLIGPLQTNKLKQALSLFDVIQTLDRPKLAEAISKHTSPLKTELLIQVNTGSEPQKSGILPTEADEFITYCTKDLRLNITGLMCIPPAEDIPAPHFALLYEMAKRHGLKELSMGMSGDYKEAIQMGATIIRIGTGIFGERGD